MAIALGSAAVDGGNNGGSTSSLTFAVTVAAGESLIVHIAGDAGTGVDNVTSVVWNGSENLTLAQKNGTTNINRFTYQYEILAPTSGTHNVVITCGTNHFILAGAVTYTGMKSTQPGQVTATAFSASTATLATTLTTTVDNSWTVLTGNWFNSSAPLTNGTGSTRRTFDAAFGTWTAFDSNAAITPAASTTMTITAGIGFPVGTVMASYEPSVAVAGKAFPYFTKRPVIYTSRRLM